MLHRIRSILSLIIKRNLDVLDVLSLSPTMPAKNYAALLSPTHWAEVIFNFYYKLVQYVIIWLFKPVSASWLILHGARANIYAATAARS